MEKLQRTNAAPKSKDSFSYKRVKFNQSFNHSSVITEPIFNGICKHACIVCSLDIK